MEATIDTLYIYTCWKNMVRNNFFERYNSVGDIFMYSSGTIAIGNTIKTL